MTQQTVRVMNRIEIIQGLRAHALKNARKPGAGWDFVEKMSDACIDQIIGIRTKSVLGAVQMMVQVGPITAWAAARDAQARYDEQRQIDAAQPGAVVNADFVAIGWDQLSLPVSVA